MTSSDSNTGVTSIRRLLGIRRRAGGNQHRFRALSRCDETGRRGTLCAESDKVAQIPRCAGARDRDQSCRRASQTLARRVAKPTPGGEIS